MRTGFTLPQVTAPIATWASKNNIKRVFTLVTDYGPASTPRRRSAKKFKAAGGEIVESVRTPLRNPDYAPFLQRAKDAKPDALFVFVPSGEGLALMKQFDERGLEAAGHQADRPRRRRRRRPAREHGRAGARRDHVDPLLGGARLAGEQGVRRRRMTKANPGMRPNFHSVGGYDGMQPDLRGGQEAAGRLDGEQLVEAMKGMKSTSPRGPMPIDPATRDVVQTVYMRKVER